jgi:hypothetical protein
MEKRRNRNNTEIKIKLVREKKKRTPEGSEGLTGARWK